MRLNAISLENLAGLDRVQISGLSDVVVLAGPNGVGKTRLLRALIDFFQNPRHQAGLHFEFEATSDLESRSWGKRNLNTTVAGDVQKLAALLHRNQRRNHYRSTVLNFDSERTIVNIQPFNFSWDIQDPYEEDVGWDFTYRFLRDRFNDVRHSLFRLVEGKRKKIADIYERLEASGLSSMPVDLPDPLDRFKDAFSRLLAPKKLIEVNVRTQQILYEFENQKLDINTLSSGEREVINIVFDFLLRNPSDCIILFDEPELHLHPELSYKLLQTLSSIGKSNQFIFCTHSPEIITASIENTVIFLTPKKADKSNQALIVRRDDATNHALNLLGQSIGIISLGKKLLLIEGRDASLDKQTYGAILQNEFPELVLVPVGGKSAIQSFDEIRESILNKAIWGVEFFMLCDRDAQYDLGPKSVEAHLSDRLRVLPRYHLENYFLDEFALAKVFTEMEAGDSWLKDATEISKRLKSLATQTVPLTVALKISALIREKIGNVDVMPKGINTNCTPEQLIALFDERLASEKKRIEQGLDPAALNLLASSEYETISRTLVDGSDTWKSEIPGKVVFNRFASMAQIQQGRLKTLYLRKARECNHDPFAEIRTIFREIRRASVGN